MVHVQLAPSTVKSEEVESRWSQWTWYIHIHWLKQRLRQLLVWKVSFGDVISRHAVHHGSSEVFTSPKRTIVEIRCFSEGQYTWSSGPDENNTCLASVLRYRLMYDPSEDARLLAQGLNCPWSVTTVGRSEPGFMWKFAIVLCQRTQTRCGFMINHL
jgi:hypothetical protein